MTSALVPEAASADRLTEALRRGGALCTGRVSEVEVLTSLRKLRSHTFRLRLTYEEPAVGAPSSLVLKMGHMDGDGRPATRNRREIAFYRDVAPALPKQLVPAAFDLAEATETSRWHLLFEDLTETHIIDTEHPLPPADATCRSIVQRWGCLHASLWDKPNLCMFAGRPVVEHWAEDLSQAADRYARFIDRFGDVMSTDRRRLCERILAQGHCLLKRVETGRHLTLIHGDAHWWNCFVPRDRHQDEVRLIDWEDWGIGAGSMDLAYMIAMLWFPERRRALEQPLLDCYHETLLREGVAAYSRSMLDDDYRWSVLLQVLRPIVQATTTMPARVWWPNLERNFLAFEDLDCEELLS